MTAPRSLVVRLDSAGDVLLAGPAVRAVAAGSSHTTLLCGPQGVPAARLLPGVDQVLVYEAPWVGLDPGRTSREECELLVDALSAGRFDRGVVLVSYHQSPLPTALLLALAGVERVAADCEEYPGSLLALRRHRRPGRHEAEAALDLVRDFGYSLPPGDDGALRVLPPPDTTRLTGPEPYVVLHPGAAVASRRWSADRAARAVAALHGAGHRVVVTGSRAEKDLTAEVTGRHGLDLGGATGDLHELAGVLAHAGVVVTGNTGPMHLACAVGTPVVCAFAPVVPAGRWRPYRVPHVLLGDQDAACAGSRARDCPVAGHPCLDGVGDDEVLAAVATLLSPEPGNPDRAGREPGDPRRRAGREPGDPGPAGREPGSPDPARATGKTDRGGDA